MAEYSISDDHEVIRLGALSAENPDDFNTWESLIQAVESQEGGINRNSGPNAITCMRETYDRFLARYPLYYAFWKRYADLEYRIAGTEAAELVYERGIASTGISVDLWAFYCAFKVETSHDTDVIRELFERGADSVGLDFHSHPFWDKYIDFEIGSGQHARGLIVLRRVLQIPLSACSQYYQRFQTLSANRPVTELVDETVFAQLQVTLQQELGPTANDPQVYNRALRGKIEELAWANFQHIQQEVANRHLFEQNINPTYYHVTPLADDQFTNWHKYLDYEEQQGDYDRIKTLYERCLVLTANYEEFWFRYVRWMMSRDDKTEEIRNIYIRASCVFIRVADPAIRLAWAKWEEAQGRADVAADIHEAILLVLPENLDIYKSWIQVRRRNGGLSAVDELLQDLVSNFGISVETRGALVVEWARLKRQLEGADTNALALFKHYQAPFAASRAFWSGWLQFEVDRSDADVHDRVRAVHLTIQTTPDLSREALKALATQYMTYLDVRGGPDAMRESVLLDAFVNGTLNNRSAPNFDSLFAEMSLSGATPRLRTLAEDA